MVAALLRAALQAAVAGQEEGQEEENVEQEEVDERLRHIEPVVRAAVLGHRVPDCQRAKRNLAEHALHGQGAPALRAACSQPTRAQRGGRRIAALRPPEGPDTAKDQD